MLAVVVVGGARSVDRWWLLTSSRVTDEQLPHAYEKTAALISVCVIVSNAIRKKQINVHEIDDVGEPTHNNTARHPYKTRVFLNVLRLYRSIHCILPRHITNKH